MTEVTVEQLSIYAKECKATTRNVIIEPNINFTGIKIHSEVFKAASALRAILTSSVITIRELCDTTVLDVEKKEIARKPIEPVLEFMEVEGGAIYNLFKYIQDLQLKQLNGTATEEERKLLFDMLFIEPDPTYKVAVRAWQLSNVIIKQLDGPKGKRDLTIAPTYKKVRVILSGETKVNNEVIAEAQKALDDLSAIAANPYNRAKFVEEVTNNINTSGEVNGENAAGN